METHIPVVFLNLKRMSFYPPPPHKKENVSHTSVFACRLIINHHYFLLILLADDLSSQDQFEVPEAGGWDATLSGEDEDDFFDLQIVKHYDGEVRMEQPELVFSAHLGTMSQTSFLCPTPAGESRGIMGLHRPRVSPAESRGSVARAAGISDSSCGGSAQPSCRHAAGSEKEDLRQRQPRPSGFCPQLSQKDVHPQHHPWLWGHL